MDNKDEKTLHEAVISSDVAAVKKIILRDPACVNYWNRYFQTPLHVIYENLDFKDPVQHADRLPILKLLVEHGAHLDTKGPFFETALHMTVQKNQFLGVKFLVENEANPNVMNQYNHTSLWYTLFRNYKDILELMLKHNADPNLIDCNDQLPLDRAMAICWFDSAKILIKFGAKSINIYESLQRACKVFSTEPGEEELKPFVEYLLKHATEIDIHNKFTPKALLCYLESKNHKRYDHEDDDKCVLYELLHELDINVDDGMGDSELHKAVRDGDEKTIEDLLVKGEDVNVKNFFGDTPLHLITKGGEAYDEEKCNVIASLLIKHGADPQIPNCIDETPFYLASNAKNIRIVNLILAEITGADKTTLDNSESRLLPKLTNPCNEKNFVLQALIVAIALDYEMVVKRLLDVGCIDEGEKSCCRNVNVALQVATKKRSYSILKMLLEAGFRTDERFTMHIPQFCIKQCNEDDLRIACLFWEFKDSVTINLAMFDSFREIVQKSIVNEFSYLMIFYYVIYLRLNRSNWVSIPARGLFKSHETMSKILSECNDALDELKGMKVGRMSYFNIITLPLDYFINALKDENHAACVKLSSSLENKGKLKYYEYAVKVRIDLAMEKKRKANPANETKMWGLLDSMTNCRIS